MDGETTPDLWPAGTLMARLDRRERVRLLRLGFRKDAGTGTVLLRQGTSDTHVILLHRGLTKVTSTTADGHTALLAIRVAGDMIGEMAALNGRPRSATVTTCGPCAYGVIRLHEFQTFLTNHPDAALRVAGMVADRLRWANEFRVEFASYPARVRLARVIVKIAQTYGYLTPAGLFIGVQLTQPELASLCGAAEITVQKVLREFRRDGLIDTGYRRITVLDAPGLRLAGLVAGPVLPS